VLLCIACLGALAALPASAAAGTWTTREIVTPETQPALYGIDCPTIHLCVAAGGNDTIVSSTAPTGPASAWTVVHPGAGATPSPTENGFFNGNQIRDVACPSTRLCVAVSLDGVIYTTTEPTGGSGAWTVADLSPTGPNIHMYGISCPTTGFCAVAAGGGKVLTSYDPDGGVGAWAVTQLPTTDELRAISCASESRCVAVGDGGTVAASIDPDGGASAWNLGASPSGGGSIGAVSCVGTSLCVAGEELGALLISTATGASPSAWSTVPSGAYLQITAASCASATECATVDNNADLTTSTEPTGGAAAWHEENLIPYAYANGELTFNGTWGISCVPGGELCAISGARGLLLTSADPFGTTGKPNDLGGPTPVGSKLVKRPRTRIVTSPHRRIRTGRHKVRVTYRFRAESSARGFRCSFDGSRWHRCSAPVRFPVGRGHHRFRVRAIGPTGLQGPVARDGFAVLPRHRHHR
jgi:hypothetical protein